MKYVEPKAAIRTRSSVTLLRVVVFTLNHCHLLLVNRYVNQTNKLTFYEQNTYV